MFSTTPIKEGQLEYIYEWCPFCDTEVELLATYEVQNCPHCGHLLKPCSFCTVQCMKKCPLDDRDNFDKHRDRILSA